MILLLAAFYTLFFLQRPLIPTFLSTPNRLLLRKLVILIGRPRGVFDDSPSFIDESTIEKTERERDVVLVSVTVAKERKAG